MTTIYFTKLVHKKGFDIKKENLENPVYGDFIAGSTQDDCKGKCERIGMGIKNWHRCRKCRTEERI